MAREPKSNLLDVAQRLRENPMWQMSSTAPERFHTNMLHWLADTHLHAAAPVLDALGLESVANGQQSGHWSRRNITAGRAGPQVSLFVDTGMGSLKLGLVNKWKGIPSRSDLLLRLDELTLVDKRFTLLTLLDVNPRQVPMPWQHRTYADMIEPLRTCVANLSDEDSASVVRSYAALLSQLSDLKEVCAQEDVGLQMATMNPHVVFKLRTALLLPVIKLLSGETRAFARPPAIEDFAREFDVDLTARDIDWFKNIVSTLANRAVGTQWDHIDVSERRYLIDEALEEVLRVDKNLHPSLAAALSLSLTARDRMRDVIQEEVRRIPPVLVYSVPGSA